MATQVRTPEEVFKKVQELLVENLGVEESEVMEGARIREDLDADSLDLTNLIMELEDEFGIKISDEDARKLTTVGEAIDFVLAQQG